MTSRGLDAVEDLVEARGAEDDLDEVGAPVDVQVDQPGLEVPLRVPEVGARDLETPVVDLLLDLDLVELDLLGVECLDDVAEVGVEPLDLGQDLPSLCLLLVDLRTAAPPAAASPARAAGRWEVSFSRSDTWPLAWDGVGAYCGPAPSQAGHGKGVGRTANGVCRFRQMGDSRFGPMAPRQAVAAGRVPPFVRSGGLRPWTRYAALAFLFTAALIASSAARADDPASLRSEAERLQAQSTGLAAQALTVLLELYALETQLAGRRGPAGGAESKQARLEDEESSARRQLAVARSSLRAAERRLARRLQTLYVEGEVDPLAVLLGAGIARRRAHGLDGLGHVADQDVSILNQVRRAQPAQAVTGAEGAPGGARRGRRRCDGPARRAGGRQAERAGYLAGLEQQKALNDAAIAALTGQAAAAEQKGAEEASGGAASPPVSAPAPTGPPSPGTRMTVSSTGYCLEDGRPRGIPTG